MTRHLLHDLLCNDVLQQHRLAGLAFHCGFAVLAGLVIITGICKELLMAVIYAAVTVTDLEHSFEYLLLHSVWNVAIILKTPSITELEAMSPFRAI